MFVHAVAVVAFSCALPGESYYTEARIAEEAQVYDKAAAAYANCTNQDGPLTPYAAIRLIVCRAGSGGAPAALSELETLRESQPEGPWTRMLTFEIARIAMDLKRYDLAAEEFDLALDIPFNYWWLEELRWVAAENDLSNPLTQERGYDFFRNVVKTVGYIQPRIDAALFLDRSSALSDRLLSAGGLLRSKAYTDATRIVAEVGSGITHESPSYQDLQVLRARLRIADGEVREGVDALSEFASANPLSPLAPGALLYAVKGLLEAKNFPEATGLSARLVSGFPDAREGGEALWQLASELAKADANSQAIEHLDALTEHFPAHSRAPAALLKLGRLQQVRGSSGLAFDAYSSLMREHPFSEERIEAAYRTGRLAEKAKLRDEAEKHFRYAVENGFGTYYGHRAQHALEELSGQAGASLPYAIVEGDAFVSPVDNYKASPATLSDELQNDKRLARLRFFGAHGFEEAEWEVLGLRDLAVDSEDPGALLAAFGEMGVAYTAIQLAQESGWGLDPEGKRSPDRLRVAFPRAYWSEVSRLKDETGLDPFLILSVVRRESTYRPHVKSHAGATGLMQLMPSTAKWLAEVDAAVRPEQAAHLTNPSNSLTLGAHYLKRMMRRSGGNVIFALASYNAGPGNCDKWRKRFGEEDMESFIENIPFTETRDYVKNILGFYAAYHSLYE